MLSGPLLAGRGERHLSSEGLNPETIAAGTRSLSLLRQMTAQADDRMKIAAYIVEVGKVLSFESVGSQRPRHIFDLWKSGVKKSRGRERGSGSTREKVARSTDEAAVAVVEDCVVEDYSCSPSSSSTSREHHQHDNINVECTSSSSSPPTNPHCSHDRRDTASCLPTRAQCHTKTTARSLRDAS
ncbi:unnamed protein product, partial [Amoebophrya sp. A25]|eukprot:GSA25T00018486001.1